MNKKYLINYHRRMEPNDDGQIIWDEGQIEVPTREEADQKALDLQDEGYENIIIEEVRI